MTETKITYNVDDAIAALNKLNKKVGEAADHVVSELGNKASGGLDKFIDGLGDVSPVAGNVASKIRDLAASLGPMGLVAGTAAAGLAAVASNLVDLPELLSDSTGKMQAFGAAIDKQLRIFEQFDDIGDNLAEGRIQLALRELQAQRNSIVQEQVRLSNLKAVATEEISIAKQVISEKEGLLRDSVSRQKTLQRELDREQAGQRVRQVEGGALRSDRAVGALAEEARKEALKGNVDLAKDLRDRAQELSDELGGHVFFQKQVDAATETIAQKMKDQVKDEAKIQAGLQGEVNAAKELVALRQRELDIIKERERLLRNELKGVKNEQRSLNEQRTQIRQTDTADRGAGEFIAATTKLRAEFTFGAKSVGDNIKDSFRQSFAALGSKATRDAGIRTEEQALKLVEQVSKVLLKPQVTPREVQSVQPQIQQLQSFIGALQTIEASRGLPGQERNVDQLERIIDAFIQAGKGTADFTKGLRTEDQVIERGSTGPDAFASFNRKVEESGNGVGVLEDAATRAADSLNRLANPTAVAPVANPAAQIPQAPAARPGVPQPAAQSNITVNANVRGGIIDREVTEKITDIIRRELRKQTGTSVSN